MTSNNSKKRFCVVQFSQPPYKGIKDYVCVPSSWIIIRRSLHDGKVLATFPSCENPENKARAKRNEKPCNTWNVFKATVKYESNSFTDAEHWIATRNDNGDSTEDPQTKGPETEPEPVSDRKLRSATRYPRKPMINEENTSQHTREDELLVQPGPSNASPTDSIEEQLSAMHENCRKEASMPMLDDCEPNEVTIIDKKLQPDSQCPASASEPQCLKELLLKQNVQKTSARGPEVLNKNNCQKTNPHRTMMAAPNIAPKPSTSGSHLFQSYQHNGLTNLTVCGKSFKDSKPREIRRERSTEVTYDDQRPRQHVITKNILFTPYNLPTSEKASSMYNHTSEKQRSSVMKNSNSLIGSQTIINSTNQSCSLPPCSIEKRTNLVNQSQQETPLAPGMHGRHVIKENSSQGSFRSDMESWQNGLQAEKLHYNRSVIVNPIGLRTCHQDITNKTSVSQNLLNLAHHANCSIQRPENLLIKENNLQQIPQVQYNTHVITPENQNLVQSMTTFYNTSRLFAERNQTQIVDPHSFFYPLSNLQVPVYQNDLQQERLSEVQPRIFTERDQTDHRIPQGRMYVSSTEQNVSNVSTQFNQDSEILQSPYHQKSCDPYSHQIRPGIPIKSKRYRQKPGLQGVMKKPKPPPVLPIASNIMSQSFLTAQGNYPIKDLRTQGRPNKRSTEQKKMAWESLPQNIMAVPTPVMQNIDVQNASSSDRSHEIQTKSVYENQVYQNPCSFNMNIDQSTDTHLNTKHVHFLDGIVGSSAVESSSMKIDKMCQTDECLSEEPQSPDPEFVTEHESVADHEATSDSDTSEETPAEIISNDRTTETILPRKDCTVKPIHKQEKEQAQSRIEVNQQLRHQISNLFVVMNTNISNTYDKFNNVQSQINETAKLYQRMVEAFNVMKNSMNINTSISRNVVPETSQVQVPDENQSGEGNPNNYGIDVTKANIKIHGYRQNFIYPPDYDPNDSTWTLKYRKNALGLVELTPQSDIYVGHLRFQYCKRVSKNCQTLVRMLLPEVFSLSALSVCSLTGRKEKASDCGNEIRPGLHKRAIIVLLKFVKKFGLQCGWDISDHRGMINSMQNKIIEIRDKYGETTSVPILYLPNRLVTTT